MIFFKFNKFDFKVINVDSKKMKDFKVSIVIPVFNSSKNLEKLINELFIQLKNNYSNYEAILIDDQSNDNTWKVVTNLCKIHNWIKAIKLRKNVGQHNAILAGLRFADGQYIVTMDDDGQNSPNDITNLISEVEKGVDVCYAKFSIKEHSIFRRIGSSINNIFVSILFNKPLSLNLTNFRSFNSQIKDELIKNKSPSIYLDALIVSLTRNISQINVEHHDRKYGKSNYTFYKLLSLWFQMATGFSVKPLRIASLLGIIFSLSSFTVLIWLVFIRSPSSEIPMGWTSLIVVMIFFGGIQLLALGLIGEYLGRTYLLSNNHPQFSIKESKNIQYKS